MEELFSSILQKADSRDSSLIDDMSKLESSIIKNDGSGKLQFSQISDEIDRNATILWNKAVTVTREIKSDSSEVDQDFVDRVLPEIRVFVCKLFKATAGRNKEKLFRASTTTEQVMYDARRFKEANDFFELSHEILPEVDLSVLSNAQCVVQMYITKAKTCIAEECNSEKALEVLKELVSSFNVASTSLTSYILRTADSLKSLEWSSFAFDVVKNTQDLGDAWIIDTASLHISLLISNGKEKEALCVAESLNIEEEAKEFIKIKTSILCHKVDADALEQFADNVSMKYLAPLAQFAADHAEEIGPSCIQLIKKAAKKFPKLGDSAIKAAIALDNFLLASSLSLTEAGAMSCWNHAVDLRTERKYTEAAQWASLVLTNISKDKYAKVLRFQSRCFTEAGEYEHAEALAIEAIRRDNSSSSHYALIIALIREGKLHEASKHALECNEIDNETLSMCASLFINYGHVSESIQLCTKALKSSKSSHVVRVLASAIQRSDDFDVIKESLEALAHANVCFDEIDSAVRRAISVSCYNTCRRGPLEILILGLEAAEAADSSDALSIAAADLAFTQKNIDAMNRILELAIEKATLAAESIRVQLAIISGKQGVAEISLLTSRESLTIAARSVCSITIDKQETIIALIEKAKELEADEDTCSALLVSFIHMKGGLSECSARFEMACSFADSMQISQAGYEALTAYAWNTGRELIGSNNAEWWLSKALSISSKNIELASLHSFISSQYDSFIQQVSNL